ncbi:probable LRR receptor-like serine/threonine-protein kinase At1g56140 isoform X2 [Camellia sinensis]|uniref:probable LRR receptor-like serine/threonine-protein kinase At1g56140 isoform X2 n=1 Tax=Camellia sinensis TaxID=4442 RepID=UPI00103638AF|nr:probable LRR receptor-like serine/threonine-protein kinase At1g56140 isoform X2 [Camellia sinensis]
MFVALRNLQTVWASDNELTGSIPEFIGNWSKLKSLRFQGNSFGGSIPTTFSNLTLMEDLILRNNNISGSIPSNIGDYQRFLQL